MTFCALHRLTLVYGGVMWLLAPRSLSSGEFPFCFFSLDYFRAGFLAVRDIEAFSCCVSRPYCNLRKQDMEENRTSGYERERERAPGVTCSLEDRKRTRTGQNFTVLRVDCSERQGAIAPCLPSVPWARDPGILGSLGERLGTTAITQGHFLPSVRLPTPSLQSVC